MASIPSEIRLTSRQQKSLLQLRNRITKLRQERGRDILRGNGVLSFKESEPLLPETREFLAVVRGSRRYEVFINLSSHEATADCDCEDSEVCKHCYCALSILLSRAVIENDSANRPARDMIVALEKAHGRKLSPSEGDYLERLEQAWDAVKGKNEITVWDLRGLLPAQFGGGASRVELWPRTPADIREFWHYLAHAITAKGHSYPPFMQPVTDFALIAGQVHEWLHQREIDQWQHRLEELIEEVPPENQMTLGLRLRVEVDKFILEHRVGAQTEFVALKPVRIRGLVSEIEEGTVGLSGTARVFWRGFAALFEGAPAYAYTDPAAARVLDDLLRMPFLRTHLAGIDGAPLEFAAEPLAWRIVEEGETYEMELVTAAGTPPLRILACFAGHPSLYLTARTVYAGPPPAKSLPASEKTRIPSEVIESPAGARALIKLDAPLPPKVRERVRRIPLHLHFTGELAKPMEDYEYLELDVRSVDPQERFHGRFHADGWQPLPKAPRLQENPDILEIPDASALAGAASLLEGLPVSYDSFSKRWSCKVTRKFPEQFADWLLTLPESAEVQLDKTLASFQKDALIATFDLEIEEAGVDWFDIRSSLKIEDTDLTKEEISLLLKAGGQYVRLGAKGWRKLSFALSAEDDETLARIGLSAADLNGEPQRLHVLQLAGQKANRLLPDDLVERIALRANALKLSVAPPIPETIHATLRPYQIEGAHFLAYLSENNFGGILADDMGLGKTLQTLAWLAWLREQPGNATRPILVVCPKSVTDNWISESARFYPTLRIGLWREKKTAKMPAFLKAHDVLVLNYAQLRSCETALQAVKWLAVILDEGQFIKNPGSQTAQAARALRSDHRLILTGTPIENRLLDLWSLMSFAMPGILGKQARFQTHFNEKKDPLATRRLAARVKPFLLRRGKKEVATDLPDRIEEDLLCEMEGAQLTRYRAELKIARQYLLKIQTAKQLDQDRFHILTSLLRLRQICAHPGLADTTLTDAESAKQEALFDLLEPLIEEGHKVLVFSQFVSMLNRLQTVIQAREWKSFCLTGDTEDRGNLVQSFQNHPGGAVFLISLRAGGFGLNLTSASYVVLYDPWWNPAVENQAIDRTHRIGQVNKVIAYRLITKDSIEEKIRALQKSKGALAQDILGEENFVRALTLDDFRYLLNVDEE